MKTIEHISYIYISFGGMERYDDQRLKNDELNIWIKENVSTEHLNYARWGNPKTRPPYLAGIYLYPEQAVIYKLKFGYDKSY
jgi:hypothetical protein